LAVEGIMLIGPGRLMGREGREGSYLIKGRNSQLGQGFGEWFEREAARGEETGGNEKATTLGWSLTLTVKKSVGTPDPENYNQGVGTRIFKRGHESPPQGKRIITSFLHWEKKTQKNKGWANNTYSSCEKLGQSGDQKTLQRATEGRHPAVRETKRTLI